MRVFFSYIMGIMMALYLGHVAMGPTESLDLENTKAIRVVAGETLWEIASRETPNSMDVREMIYQIKELNHIEDAMAIRPGEIVQIPTIKKQEASQSTKLAMYLQNER